MKGFTLVELVIVIAIVIILSVVSVPIYRNYVDKAKWSEAYALLGTVLSAQKAYYSEYGHFYHMPSSGNQFTENDENLGIDARGNKFFSQFRTWNHGEGFDAYLKKPQEFYRYSYNGTDTSINTLFGMRYFFDGGISFKETNSI